MNTKKCLALFSGGLDSSLAVAWMRKLGYDVVPITFRTPYITADKAEHYARENGLPIVVKDISERHFAMLRNPAHGYGKHVNPCIDCHALMFEVASEMLIEYDASFLISGEVLGQRPMSQHKNALATVNKASKVGDLIVRPLSQKLLPDTKPIRENWVDKEQLLDFQGRGRSRQVALAAEFGISFPPPGGGCSLTDRSFTLRYRELKAHNQENLADVSLLKWGRHFRLDVRTKLVLGRDEQDNLGMENENYPGTYLLLRDNVSPLGLITSLEPSPETLRLAASILLSYSKWAAQSDVVKYGVDKILSREIRVEKCPEDIYRPLLITLD